MATTANKFLAQIKSKIADGQFLFEDSGSRHTAMMLRTEMSANRKIEVIGRLTAEDALEGPTDDPLYGKESTWLFSKDYNSITFVIKLSIAAMTGIAICVEFDKAKYISEILKPMSV